MCEACYTPFTLLYSRVVSQVMDPLSVLPEEIVSKILRHLSVNDVHALSHTCSSWRNVIARDDLLWKSLCVRYCEWSTVAAAKSTETSWKVDVTNKI